MDNINDKNKASKKLRELLYKSNKTIKKNGVKYKFILDDDTILALKIAINNLENSETDKALIRLNFMLDDNKRLKTKLNNYEPETDDEFIEVYHSIKGSKDELIKELDKNIKSLKLAIQRIGG